MKKFDSLQNKLLIATPSLADPYFSQSVVYLYEHDKTGSTGFIINKPMDITMGEVLARVDLPLEAVTASSALPMLLGGPVKQEQMFLIHTLAEKGPSLSPAFLSSSKEVLGKIALGEQANVMAFLGHAAWKPGQLEAEIKENSWLIASLDYDLLYKVPFNRRYDVATLQMGFDISQLSEQVGNA